MKKPLLLFTAYALLFLSACGTANRGSIDDATILNWENDMVTMEQFTRDHMRCLGITRPLNQPRSRLVTLLMPAGESQMPDWDGLWVTFQSNEYTEIGQRVLLSVPPNQASNSIGSYRKCMFNLGYLLRAS